MSAPSAPVVQHQYKVHPTPDPSDIQLRPIDVEEHRYEDIDDSPPRYSRLNASDSSNLLSFDDSCDEKHSDTSQLYYNLGEFDPYAPNDGHITSKTGLTSLSANFFIEL